MKNPISFARSIIPFLFLLLGLSCVSRGQADSYIRLADASGFDTDPYQEQLERAADSLVAALPEEFRADFKVFDFGFYLHNETFEGGYPEAFDLAIQEAASQSTYYLLFGKQSDQRGIYTKFWVDI